jgi:DNA-binding NtrC family response regulator
MSQGLILMIDDDETVLRAQKSLVVGAGLDEPIACTNGQNGAEILQARPIDAVLLDLLMPGEDGEELLRRFQELRPDVPVIVLTAVNDVDTAVRCVQKGAYDYLVKPVEPDRLLVSLRRALSIRAARSMCREMGDRLLDGKLRHSEHFAPILTADQKMKAVFLYLEAIASTGQPILLNGETGTGKELLARAVHLASGRTGPFHAVNVAGVDDSMLNDTLFGHVKGAYTGAMEPRKGILAQADAGTVLLDEIGDLAISSQIKLLRVLENGEYYPLGSDLPRRTNARFLLSTHLDLEALVKDGRFRNDLYYRIAMHRVRIPPLRERFGDLNLLVDHFVAQAAGELGRPAPRVPAHLYSLLGMYPFPGNVRELRALVYAAVGRSGPGHLSASAFHEIVTSASAARGNQGAGSSEETASTGVTFGHQLPTLRDLTASLIDEALRRARGSQTAAAQLLGISHQALNKRLKRTGMRDANGK